MYRLARKVRIPKGIRLQPFKFALDLGLWTLAAPAAFWLRLERGLLTYFETVLIYTLIGFLLKAILIHWLGLSRQSWHKVGILDLYRILRAITFGGLVLMGVGFVTMPSIALPRSIPIIEGLMAAVGLGGLRLFTRIVYEQQDRLEAETRGRLKRVLIVGAGHAGTLVARELGRNPSEGLRPIGFLDDEPSKRIDSVMGLQVFGPLRDLPRVVKEYQIDLVLIAMPSAPGEIVRQVVDMARAVGVEHRAIPGVYQILSGKVLISQFRDVDVEDLLRREPVNTDKGGVAAYIGGKRVLVSGAGGSIGSEIVRQIAPFGPAEIVLLGRGENSLYEFQREFDRVYPDIPYHTVIADIRQRDRLAYIFETYRPEVVFHAAAHKHVPLMEANPDEAIFNNVQGTRNIAELALDNGVERFVNISTDKAVNPTSIMGATKRIAEKIVTNIANRAGDERIFVSVRFGNVLGSRGSVIPIFKKQIERGGPLTVTHPEVQRYFMTIPEASQLVLQAGRLGRNGCVYVLDMGEPVKIVDLARDLIRLSGLEPDRDIQIEYIGLRPGEKLYEELLTAEEGVESSRTEKIYIARINNHLDLNWFDETLDALFTAAARHDEGEMRRLIKILVPTYDPQRGGTGPLPRPPADTITSGNGQHS